MKKAYLLSTFLLLSIIYLLLLNASTTKAKTPDFTEMECRFDPLDIISDSFTIGMIGDVLLHNPLYKYEDFSASFEGVSSELGELDLLFANLESMPGGVKHGLSSYPRFNSPEHIVRDLKEVGVDFLSIANNHTIDKGPDALLSAIRNIESYGLPYNGAYKSAEDSKTDRIIDVDGMKIGFLAYTYGMNGLTLPGDKMYMVSIIDPMKMAEDAKRLQDLSEIVIMSIHWGDEYSLTPNKMQLDLSQQMADAGVDVIFGHHPHVLQPYELVNGASGNQTHVFYSLGNFFSAQPFPYTNVGGIGSVEITRTTILGKHFYNVVNPSFFPTSVIVDEDLYKVVSLKEGKIFVGVDEKWVLDHMGIE